MTTTRAGYPVVMPGLDSGIHPLTKKMDCQVKPGNDN